MFFAVSKIFWLIAEPMTFLVLLTLLGAILLFTRRARAGRRIVLIAALGFSALFLTPLGVALLRPLEDRFPPPAADLAAPTGIIVLGGGLEQRKTEARGQPIINGDGARLIAGLELARRYPDARLIFTGGSGDFLDQSASEATGVRQFWSALGAPMERVDFESRSRNTFENAIFTRDLVHPKPGQIWLLVTSAWHMPRSMGVFRRAGFDVVAYPVAYRTIGDERDFRLLAAASDRVGAVDLSLREWVGLFSYWLTCKTSALFPAP